MSNWEKYRRHLTILFIVSLVGLALHAIDDAYVTREPDWFGVSPEQFLLLVGATYLIVPPIGLWLARRGKWLGLVILAGYTFQALYGAGINHVRHLFGNFSGSQFLPTVLTALKMDYASYANGKGFVPILMNMAGLGITPPHTHTLASNIIVFCNIAINLTLFYYVFLSARELWRQKMTTTQSTRNIEKKIINGL